MEGRPSAPRELSYPRPGTDPLAPHTDLHIPTVLQGNGTSSSGTGGGVSPSSREASSDGNRSLLIQAASLHRAAEVARWQWIKAHQEQLAQCGVFRTRVRRTRSPQPPISRSTGVGLVDLSDEEEQPRVSMWSPLRGLRTSQEEGVDRLSAQRDEEEGQQSQSASGPRRNAPFEPATVDRRYNWTLDTESTGRQRETQERQGSPRSSDRILAGSTAFQELMNTWNRMCRDLAAAAGVAIDDSDSDDGNSGPGSSLYSLIGSDTEPWHEQMSPPPFLFGFTPGSRLLPNPWWAGRYPGAAGAWLRSELTRRGDASAGSSTSTSDGTRNHFFASASLNSSNPATASVTTPASALAEEWRRSVRRNMTLFQQQQQVQRRQAQIRSQSSAMATPHSVMPSTSERVLTFPSLDPASRTGEGTVDEAAGTATGGPSAAVAATTSTSLAMPASATFLGSLTDPWRATPTRQQEPRRRRSSGAADPERSSQATMPHSTSASVVTTRQLSTPNQNAVSVSAPVRTDVIGTSRPRTSPTHPSQTPAMRAIHEQLPESAFQVPPASGEERVEAASEVARLAEQARARRTAASQRARPVSNPSTTRRSQTAERPGMSYLRQLRSLDGLESAPAGSQPSSTDALPSSSESEFVTDRWFSAPHTLMPWYDPPPVASPRSPRSRPHASAASDQNPDADGDAVGADWYRGVRARNLAALAEQAAQRASEDPNGEQEADAQTSTALPPWRLSSATPTATATATTTDYADRVREPVDSTRRQRHRSALVIADEPEEMSPSEQDRRQDTGEAPRTVAGWTLVQTDSVRSQSSARDLGEGEAETTATWFRGPARPPRALSSSPMSMDSSATVDSNATDLRSVRRPQRMSSLSTEDIAALRSDLRNARRVDSTARERRAAVAGTATRAPPVRRTEYTSQAARDRPRPISAEEMLNAVIEGLHNRETLYERGPQQISSTSVLEPSDTPTLTHPSPRRTAQDRTSTRRSSVLTIPSRPEESIQERRQWLSNLSRTFEQELRQRHDELRASQARLTEELARRRVRIDELRQREGRIGRVLVGSDASPRHADGRVDSTTADEETRASSNAVSGSSSLVRRRTLRDAAPGLRAPRSVRMPDWLSPHDSLPRSLRRASSGSSLVSQRRGSLSQTSSDDKSPEESIRPVERLHSRSQDDSSIATTTAASSVSDRDAAMIAPWSEILRRLVSEEDRSRLGVEGVRMLQVIDEYGVQHYLNAMAQAHSQRAMTRSPHQPALPSSSQETNYLLRFEAARFQRGDGETGRSNSRNVLRNNESALHFDAKRGVEVFFRFLAAAPPSPEVGSSHAAAASGLASPYPTSRADEDLAWSTARERIIGRRNSSSRAREQRNERRALLGMSTIPDSVEHEGSVSQQQGMPPAARSGVFEPLDWLHRLTELTLEEADLVQRLAAASTANRSAGPSSERLRVLSMLSSHELGVLRHLIRRTLAERTGEADQQRLNDAAGNVDGDLVGCPPTSPTINTLPLPDANSAPQMLTNAIPLSGEEVQRIQNMITAVKTRTGGLIPVDVHRVKSLIGGQPVDEFVASRAKAVLAAATRFASVGQDGMPIDPLGPLFTLETLTVKVQRRCNAVKTLHGLVFVSDEPLTRARLAPWSEVGADSVRRIARQAGVSGPGLACLEAGLTDLEEDADEDIGDPDAMHRREVRRRERSHSHGDVDLSGAEEALSRSELLPRAMITMTLGPTKTTQIVDFSQGAHACERTFSSPSGRYLAVKLLSSTEEGPMELVYIAARGRPTLGASSIAAQTTA